MPTYSVEAWGNAAFTTLNVTTTSSNYAADFMVLDWPEAPEGGARREEEQRRAEEAARALAGRLMPAEVVEALERGMSFRFASELLAEVEYDFPSRQSDMVAVYEKGQFVGRLCYHPSLEAGWLPDWDIILARYIMLRCAERETWRQANAHGQGRIQEMRRQVAA